MLDDRRIRSAATRRRVRRCTAHHLSGVIDSLGGFSENSGALTSEVDGFAANIAANIAASREALGDTQALLDSYRIAAGDAQDLAIAGREDLDVSITWIRLVVVVLALLIAAGQLVPWWLGSRLVEADSPPSKPRPKTHDDPI